MRSTSNTELCAELDHVANAFDAMPPGQSLSEWKRVPGADRVSEEAPAPLRIRQVLLVGRGHKAVVWAVGTLGHTDQGTGLRDPVSPSALARLGIACLMRAIRNSSAQATAGLGARLLRVFPSSRSDRPE